MTHSHLGIEPLEPELWFAALAQLSQYRAQAGADGLGVLLRRAFHLLQLTPGPLKAMVRCPLDEEGFESLLECNAFDAAAIALVGPPAAFTLQRAVGSRPKAFTATVSLPGQLEPPPPAQSANAACALVGAWSNCLLALVQQSSLEFSGSSSPA